MGGMSDSYKRCGESKNGEIIMGGGGVEGGGGGEGGGNCEKFFNIKAQPILPLVKWGKEQPKITNLALMP